MAEHKRSCTGFGFWDDDIAVDEQIAPSLFKLRNDMVLELQESQRKFAADMEKRITQALSADRRLGRQHAQKAASARQFEMGQGSGSARTMTPRTAWRQKIETDAKNPYTSLWQGGEPVLPRREPGELQLKWVDEWLLASETGELDVYTCLGLSNCFSWTPDTQKIFLKAIAVTLLQMVVPFCLLLSEFSVGIELGPAEGDIAFRVTGITLYGYAVYNMFQGASDQCRTSLLNLAWHYDHMPMGNWIPLVFGEFSNVFTAVVLVVALFSIFTTQTAPADLILNAVAVNFLGDCDGAFVSEEMKEEAQASFKELTNDFFTDPDPTKDHVENPSDETWPAQVSRYALYGIAISGGIGVLLFLFYPTHDGGMRDTIPGFQHHVLRFNNSNGIRSDIHPR